MTRQEEEENYIEQVTNTLFIDNISPMNGPEVFAEQIDINIEDL